MVAETRLSVDDLVAPLFVKEGIDHPQPIPSMPGVVQHTLESLRKEVRALADLGIPGVILFGVPARKDAVGSGADAAEGVVQVALHNLRDEVGDRLVLMADNCLDEYTDHGHCGILTESGPGGVATVDNDATLERYAAIAVAQAEAGADVVAPSGMMDGQVAAIRAAVDVPVAAYHVSGEYAMVQAAAANGWIDGDAVAREHVTAIRRAGADFVLTYFARQLAERA